MQYSPTKGGVFRFPLFSVYRIHRYLFVLSPTHFIFETAVLDFADVGAQSDSAKPVCCTKYLV